MEPVKFDDTIREKLEEREIQPSEDSWSKLSSRLGEEPRSESKKLIWFAVAAGFVGILFLTTMFFNYTGTESNSNQIVVKDKASEENGTQIMNEQNTTEIVSSQVASEEIVSNSPSEATSNVVTGSHIIKEPVTLQKKDLPKNDIASETEILNKNEQLQVKKVLSDRVTPKVLALTQEKKQEFLITNKVNEVVAQVQLLQQNNTTVTAEEIDALLATAQRDIQTQRILNNTKVDAAALLLDVEMDLEQSFREKVFEALGDGFQKVRTAVVERNQ